MNIMPFLIAVMLVVQFSMYAQSTGQVTLSIKLYPIQTIEVTSADSQTLELSNQNITTSSPSSQLSTFSTSQHRTYVDSVCCRSFFLLRAAREGPQSRDKIIAHISNDENYNSETDGDDLYLVYSMEPL